MAVFLCFLVREGLKTRHNLSVQEARINKKTKGYKMLKDYRNWLINKGYAVMVNNRPSTCYDYLRGIKYVLRLENLTIEKLAESIFDICPMYQKGGIHEIRGRQISRSVRSSLKQFNKFVVETQAA